MKFLSLLTIFGVLWSVKAENLIFNPSFELGCDGFALSRILRPDRNSDLTFLPAESTECDAPDGRRALRIVNPYAEEFELHSREYFLKRDTVYIFRAKMKSSSPDYPLYVNQFQWKWRPVRFPEVFQLSTEWREYEYRFDTGQHEGFFHLEMKHAKNSPPAGEIWIDKLELFEAFTRPDGKVEFAVRTSSPLRNRGETISFSVHVANNSPRPFQEKVRAVAREEFTGEIHFSQEFELKLSPGETAVKTFSFPGTRYGSWILDVAAPDGCEVLPETVAIIGIYTPRPIDPATDFCVGINHGLMLEWNTDSNVKGYKVYNAPFLTDFEMLARMGCRLIREHDGGYEIFSWAMLEPEENRWDNSWFDRGLAIYKKYHMEPLAVVGRQNFIKPEKWEGVRWPNWLASRLRKLENLPDYTRAHIRDLIYLPPERNWRSYVSYIARRAGRQVRCYEIFNEPNRALPAEEYFKFVRSASEEIRRVNAEAIIIGGSVTSDFNTPTDQFTRDFIRAGGYRHVDALSFHPYQGRELTSRTPADLYIKNFRETAKNPEKDLPIWNTELYYLHDNGDTSLRQGFLTPDRAAARFLLDLGEHCRQSTAIHSDSLWNLRLLPNIWNRHIAKQELRPNAVFVAYNALARLFEGATPSGKKKLPYANICYTYNRQGKPQAAIWNWEGNRNSGIDLSGFRVLDCYGNRIDNRGIIPLTSSPVYIFPEQVSAENFLKVLQQRRPELLLPISVGRGARTVEGRLFFTLKNETAQQDTIQFIIPTLMCAKQSITLDGGEMRNLSLPLSADGKPLNEISIILQKGEYKETRQIPVFHAKVFPVAQTLPVKQGATVRFQLHKNELTIQIDVSDSTDSGKGENLQPWEQDCVELFLDGNPLTFSTRPPEQYHVNCARAFLMPRRTSNSVELWFGKSKFRFLSFVRENRENGYTLLFTIELPPETLQSGYLGVDLKIDDAPSPGSPGALTEHVWSNSGAHVLANRMVFPLIQLSPSKAMTK